MASDSLTEAAGSAQGLALALDAIEAELDRLDLGAPSDVIAQALAGPVIAFAAAAKEASR